MTNEERFRNVRGEMVKAGISNAQIAREQAVSPNFVYFVLSGRRTGYRIRRAIAAALKKPVETLWPDTPPEHRRAA